MMAQAKLTTNAANFERAVDEANKVLLDNFVLEPPVPVQSIVEAYGLRLQQVPFKESEGYVCGYIDLRTKVLAVNALDHASRQAFTVAHELGHFLLHRDLLSSNPDMGVMYRKPIGGESDPREQEANAFAANLLVPELFLKEHFSYDIPIRLLAQLFGVSEDVLRYRLRSTGRI